MDFENERFTDEDKKMVLESANILLISDIQDDYDELIKYGFKNVDWFRSIIRADEYFSKNPEELEKYHIILDGKHSFSIDDVGLGHKIRDLKLRNPILETSFKKYNYGDYVKFEIYLEDNRNFRRIVGDITYTGIFDRIVENILINNTLERVDLKSKQFLKYEDYINPNRLPLPNKKSNLKILYLGFDSVAEYVSEMAEKLGLNITFKEDNNYSLDDNVKEHLGDYDIIIASHMYSDTLLFRNNESTEQCKDTGRELTLLVTYDENPWGIYKDLGDKIILRYSFGGNLAPDALYHEKEFRVLRQPIEVDITNNCLKEEKQSEYSRIMATIEASVNFYNHALIQAGKPSLSDLDFKTAEDFEQEYESAFERERERKEAELAPIREFDRIRYIVISYLKNKKSGFINELPEGLIITEGYYGIKLENIYEGRVMCSIIFPKEYKYENLRVFDIQTMTKKGTLSNPQTIGLYTSEYERLENIPNRPNEKQAKALYSIQKKVDYALRPLNEEVWDKEVQKKLELIKDNKRRKQ